MWSAHQEINKPNLEPETLAIPDPAASSRNHATAKRSTSSRRESESATRHAPDLAASIRDAGHESPHALDVAAGTQSSLDAAVTIDSKSCETTGKLDSSLQPRCQHHCWRESIWRQRRSRACPGPAGEGRISVRSSRAAMHGHDSHASEDGGFGAGGEGDEGQDPGSPAGGQQREGSLSRGACSKGRGIGPRGGLRQPEPLQSSTRDTSSSGRTHGWPAPHRSAASSGA
mmetsp:Transcript_200/g.336  ORF Transcript_200/g.336 Transcript_200/m.336 type:complete len:229 (-) Transcript_200:2060-2746(-)